MECHTVEMASGDRIETYKETTPISYSISNSTSLLELRTQSKMLNQYKYIQLNIKFIIAILVTQVEDCCL